MELIKYKEYKFKKDKVIFDGIYISPCVCQSCDYVNFLGPPGIITGSWSDVEDAKDIPERFLSVSQLLMAQFYPYKVRKQYLS